jgi:hypothetical protein
MPRMLTTQTDFMLARYIDNYYIAMYMYIQ